MLVNLHDLLQPALKEGYAVGCFNVFGYEDALAVVNAAEEQKASVILSINLDMTQFMPLTHISSMLLPLIESSSAPVCLHLDHHYEREVVMQAIDCGFSSVMFDCSQKPITENISEIKSLVKYAHEHQVSVEAEVGSVPYSSGRDQIKSRLTSVVEAVDMATEAKPDGLAISVGNIHRLEANYVDIDFERFGALEKAVKVPLVIHGTSGIRPEDIRELAQRRACKFNIGTTLRQRFGHTLRESLTQEPKLFDRLTIMQKVIPKMSEEVARIIKLLGQ